jgi:hypothetical protein
MKNSILLIFISLITLNISAQDKASDELTIDGLMSLSDISKEDADKWLTKENNFIFFQENEKYDASIYAFDYDPKIKTAPMWLYYFNKNREIFIISKKSDVDKILEQLESKKFISNLNSDGTLITTYIIENKEFIVTINSSQETTIRVILGPIDESEDDKKTRHNEIVKKN